jgi:hypothetical protein
MDSPGDAQAAGGRRWKTELYAVKMSYVQEIISRLGVPVPTVDCFSLARSSRLLRFWGPGSWICEDAFEMPWSHKMHKMLWMNPPFSILSKVISKIKVDHCHTILVVPFWEQEDWFPDLMQIAVRSAGTSIFELCGQQVAVPPTRWAVLAAYACGRPSHCFKMVQVQCPESRSKRRRRRKEKLNLFRSWEESTQGPSHIEHHC